MARHQPLWEMANMETANDKKAEAEARARDLYERLMALKGDSNLSNNDWCKAAGVNTSFFTAMKGSDTKRPSEPSIGNLRLVLQAISSSIPEFFVDEARVKLVPLPNQAQLEGMMASLLKAVGLVPASDDIAGTLARRLPKALERAASASFDRDDVSQATSGSRQRRPAEPDKGSPQPPSILDSKGRN